MNDFTTPDNVRFKPCIKDDLREDDIKLLNTALLRHGFGSIKNNVQDNKSKYITLKLTFKSHSKLVAFCEKLV